ncbi:LysR family transcriptional regulator [Acinetobacter baumannii]|uniref:LysR family transcriptional regulator n=1 Tax=Acinetobacter baumannii TaxID=470 RepID=UPI00224E34C5|nr:LysR family transcriptional regulator [Acinetobacter baumannii]MCX3035738.1 LysR family transcriptional regulator [Acinetobacter baumannii]MDA4919169.1 LysR family transcriptional regulator [Acinetobacter baumannii]MDA4941386.1 LysR family transcriptional regulator [Acinetobacter baumannii]MDC5574380.1 LysR family transcriptional regulator [Acinetobacter baumannii]HCE1007761.1 LysR family transcriptional regulator [Acinetobacter baumannii]
MDNYRQMMAFMWAYEHGSFSAAARAHDLTPSAMSKLISRLENRLGVRLILRGARQITLTEEGLAYLNSAKNVVSAMAEADSLAEGLPTTISGNLKIRTMPTFARYQILPWLAEFIDKYPLINIDFELNAVYQDDFDRGVDIAIYGGVLPSSSRIATRIGESEWITCASPTYLKKYGNPIHPQDLLQHRCFHFNFASSWNKWDFIENNESFIIPIKPLASFSQGDFLRDLALQGEGIIRLADYHIGNDIRLGKLVPILTEYKSKIKEPLYVIYANRKLQSPRIKCFIEFLQQKLKLHPWKIDF